YTSLGNILLNLGLKPVFVDVNPETLTIDTEKIAQLITSKTKAIVPVDYAGLPSDINKIRKIIKGKNIYIVQDSATSMGANYKGKKVGAVADFTCFSFYPTKNITTIEGGALATNNTKIAEKFRLLSKLGVNASAWKRHQSRTSWFFEVVEPGLKYYMNDIQSAVGLHQLDNLNKFIATRKKIAQRYYKELKDTKIISSPYLEFPVEHVWNFYPIFVNKDIDRNKFMEEMEKLGVASSVYYIPMHFHPIFKKYRGSKKSLVNTEEIFNKVATLPMYPGLTDADVSKVISVVKQLNKKLLK
ncbi:MAG TPA: DegT/DnrJ/EryC1/StrS family aminotransferase, partial [Candidatus Saccharimonadales bacterium]|nr:DegT/DnrJ/EryC1/StrS family aminotransferase [Candidatus Saccharimonadales bacterium]